jgi:hypothetical protein
MFIASNSKLFHVFLLNIITVVSFGISNSLVANIVSVYSKHRRADKSLARPGRKQATAIEDFDVHISYL